MKTYKIEWANGQSEMGIPSISAAEAIIYAAYPDAEIGHSGDLSDGGDRTLAWATEEDSVDDDGAHSCCEIMVDAE